MKLIILFFILHSGFLFANNSKAPLQMAVYLPEAPPYLFIDDNSGQLIGIVAEVLNRFSQHHNIDINYLYLNRIRAESSIYNGVADISYLAPDWVEHPDKLLFSKYIYQSNDRLYSLSSELIQLEQKQIKDKVVCAREFYRHPIFEQYIEQHQLKRMDTDSSEGQLKMMLSGRCDFIYTNEWIAKHLIKNIKTNKKIYASEKAFDLNRGALAFNKKRHHEFMLFNQFIHELHKSGDIDKIIDMYIK